MLIVGAQEQLLDKASDEEEQQRAIRGGKETDLY